MPAPADGSLVQFPLPTQSLTVQIEVPNPERISPVPYFITVLYAGPAPFEIAGFSQLNVEIPGFMLDDPGPLRIWVTMPDGSSVQSPPFYNGLQIEPVCTHPLKFDTCPLATRK